MISIDGLTKKQKRMLDIMWSMDSIDEVRSWQATPSIEDQYMCETLLSLVALAYIDEAVNEMPNYPQAKWDKKNMDRSNGHTVNNDHLAEDEAWERLRKKLENDEEMMAAFKRMKGR